MSILVRPYCQEDRPAVDSIHQSMGFDYSCPDWSKLLVSAVIEVDGKVTSAAFLRKTSEAYMLINPQLSRKRDRLAQLLMMHRELLIPAQRVGFEDVHCWLPPQIEENFGKLLMTHLGWKKPLWTCYAKELK